MENYMENYMENSDQKKHYRFYHCYQKPFSIICYPVENKHVMPSEPNSRLLFVSKYIPEVLDTFVLNYKYFKSVQIVKTPQSPT